MPSLSSGQGVRAIAPLHPVAVEARQTLQVHRAEALASFERYRALLRAEFGLEPTPSMQALIKDLQNPQ